MIMLKAEEIAKNSIKKNCSASKGWLYRFQQRHIFKFKTLHGESGFVNNVFCDEWIEETLHPIFAENKPRDIFNSDETSLV